MANFLVILLCLFLGVALKASGRLGPEGSRVVNGLVINVSLPAMVLSEMRHLSFAPDLLIAVSAPWALFALNVGIVATMGKFLKWQPEMTGALALTTGLANTSFVGFPLLEALIGSEALRIGIVVDQLGSFLILSTVAVAFVAGFSKKKKASGPLWKRVFLFPPLASFLVALALKLTPSPYPGISESVYSAISRVAMTLIPLALISVGLQLSWDATAWKTKAKPVALGLALKLIVAPAILIFFYVKILGFNNLTTHVSMLEIAMAPMITGAILAMEGGLDRHVASAMVFVGIPLSLLTVPAWHWFLSASS